MGEVLYVDFESGKRMPNPNNSLFGQAKKKLARSSSRLRSGRSDESMQLDARPSPDLITRAANLLVTADTLEHYSHIDQNDGVIDIVFDELDDVLNQLSEEDQIQAQHQADQILEFQL